MSKEDSSVTELAIGVISGTSMDAVDAVLIERSGQAVITRAHCERPIPSALKHKLEKLCTPAAESIDMLGQAHISLGSIIADCVIRLMQQNDLSPSDVSVIGSHGQTIRHRPDLTPPFTIQIGDPNTIAHLTGVPTVADFRLADMAAGGQGAPLVSAFHQQVFSSSQHDRIILNIGGISNITVLPRDEKIPAKGYDIGPGNRLMDDWIRRKKDLPFDDKGAWARSGELVPELLQQMLTEPYFAKQGPKSTGREYFNFDWLERQLSGFNELRDVDVQRTATELTVCTIADNIKRQPCDEIYVCGGGSQNTFLMERLQSALPDMYIATSDELGVDTQQVEAAAFAWLGTQTIAGLPGNVPAVTGAGKPKILGGLYLP